MIPLKLRLRNFMCYRDNVPPLLLDNIHIACLCGPNGAGKSALLDAITWALWGEARARSDDDLINLGRDEMEVELEFLARGHRYRVVRKRERSAGRRAGKTVLELHAATGAEPPDEPYRPITANTVRETQRKIIELLRMDYKTFTNSAFLVQGRADEFTLKPPDQRKQVLAEILDLAYYDRLEERAREKARRLRTERHALEERIAEDEAELARRPEYEARATEVQRALDAAQAELEAAQALARERRAARDALALKQAMLDDARHRLADLGPRTGRLRSGAAALERDVAAAEAVLAEEDAIADGHRRLTDARARKERLDAAARAYLDLVHRKNDLERAIERRRAELATQARLIESRLGDARDRASALPALSAELAQAREALAALDASEQRLSTLRGEAEAALIRATGLRAANDQLRQEMDQVKANMERLRAGHGTCPLCSTDLGQDRCEHVLADYQRQGEERAAAHRANQAEEQGLQEAEARVKRELRDLEAHLRAERPRLQARVAEREVAARDAAQAQEGLPRTEAALAEARGRHAEGAFARDDQQALEGVTAAIAALAYDRAAHEAAESERVRLQPFEERRRALDEARRRLPQDRTALHDAHDELERLDAEASRLGADAERLARETASLPAIARELEAAEARQGDASAQAGGLRQALGAARRDLDLLDQRQREWAARRESLARAADELGVYDELATAFGGRGLQALIIESALPEIEDEANRLLGRMTDNRMHVKLDTQTGYKTKEGVKETLEIAIHDGEYTRSYETFSGGETYRINLALRIALSRLLARRAGAPLPTLFIDEGFGTQDPAGRDKVVEAINAIRDDFACIIVITHIDELKEQFPTRIEVERTPEGSTFWLS